MKSYGQVTIRMKAFWSYFHRVSAVFQHFTKWNLENSLNFDFGPFWEGKQRWRSVQSTPAPSIDVSGVEMPGN